MKKSHCLTVCLATAVFAMTACQKSNPEIEPFDYSQDSNWMLKPSVTHEVDVFYIYPTSANPECTTLVAPVDGVMKEKAYFTYQQNAECFSGYTNVFAPYYRQIGAAGILECKTYEDLIEMDRQNEPWTDIKAALDYYFKYLNTNRPVVFASHSQGSAVMHIVMDTYMQEHPELKKRIVAVYALGMCATQEWCGKAGIPFATGEEDTGCYITWNTEGPGATAPSLPVGENSLIINPLNWKCDATYAGKELNKGSLKTNDAGVLEKVPGRADAQINLDRRVLICTTDTSYVPANPVFGDKSLHFEDGALFYENMKENGRKRVAAYLGHEPR